MASQEWKEEIVHIAGIEMPVIKGGSGKPLLILHDELGYPGWLGWQRALARERTLVIPMAPGFSRAPRIEWVENVRDLACVYARLLREQDLDNIDVIGFSFGGWLAAEMIATNVGLGYMLFVARDFYRTEVIVLGMIVIGLLWLLIDRLLLVPLERATIERWGLVRRT